MTIPDASIGQNRGLLRYSEQTARSAEKICDAADEIKVGRLAWQAGGREAKSKATFAGGPWARL
jgi:hypothetical protein